MDVKFKKSRMIMDSMVSYFYDMGAREFEMKLLRNDGGYMIEIIASVKLSSDRFETMVSELNYPRQMEVEQNYWEISGECDSIDDLALIGMMIDRAEFECFDDRIITRLWRE